MVNAQLAATDKPKARVALLTAALKGQRETLKMVEHADSVNLEADVLWWRSISLDTEIRLLSTRKSEAAQIKALKRNESRR